MQQKREEICMQAKLKAVDRLKQLSRTLIACKRSMTLSYPFIWISHLSGMEKKSTEAYTTSFVLFPNVISSPAATRPHHIVQNLQVPPVVVSEHISGGSVRRFSSEITWTCPLTVQLDQSVASSQAQQHAGGLQTVAGHLWNNDSIIGCTSAVKWAWLHPSMQKYKFVCVVVCTVIVKPCVRIGKNVSQNNCSCVIC